MKKLILLICLVTILGSPAFAGGKADFARIFISEVIHLSGRDISRAEALSPAIFRTYGLTALVSSRLALEISDEWKKFSRVEKEQAHEFFRTIRNQLIDYDEIILRQSFRRAFAADKQEYDLSYDEFKVEDSELMQMDTDIEEIND